MKLKKRLDYADWQYQHWKFKLVARYPGIRMSGKYSLKTVYAY